MVTMYACTTGGSGFAVGPIFPIRKSQKESLERVGSLVVFHPCEVLIVAGLKIALESVRTLVNFYFVTLKTIWI